MLGNIHLVLSTRDNILCVCPARAHICRRSDNINNSINTSRNARALAAIGVPRALAGDSITITISISIASALGGAIHGDISVAAPRGDGGRVRPPLHRPLHGLRSRPCNRRRRAPHRVRRHDCRLRAQIQGIKQIKSTKKLQEGRRQTKRSFCNNRWKCKFMALCRVKYTPNAQNCGSDISSTCNTYAARACVLRLRQGKTYEDPIKRMFIYITTSISQTLYYSTRPRPLCLCSRANVFSRSFSPRPIPRLVRSLHLTPIVTMASSRRRRGSILRRPPIPQICT